MPVLFVGHGSPMNAIEQNEFSRNWAALGRRLPRPATILCISAHWETRNAYVTAGEMPETIHDFYGFPKALFDVCYPARGNPALARRVADLVTSERVRLEPGRGIDHGAWGVLIAMYPEADVSVVQLSIDTGRPGAHHYALARQLAPLRDEGVLIVGSGNVVHNLQLLDFRDLTPPDWALRADAEIRAYVLQGDHAALADYPARAQARQAVPTPEHYLPLLYAIALQQSGESAEIFNASVLGTVSMSSVLIGGPPQA
jgi:4,5-DOPA dioxygenase extradiol